VRLPPALVGEDVEDPVLVTPEPDGEPRRRGGFVLDERERRDQEPFGLLILVVPGLKPYEQSLGHHICSSPRMRRSDSGLPTVGRRPPTACVPTPPDAFMHVLSIPKLPFPGNGGVVEIFASAQGISIASGVGSHSASADSTNW
jgi:hypothetical protein